MPFFESLYPFLDFLDQILLGLIPRFLAFCLWGLVAGLLTMGLYVFLSPQKKLSKTKEEIKVFNAKLKQHHEDFREVLNLVSQNFFLSLKSLGLVLFPSAVSVLPALIIGLWLHASFSNGAVTSFNDVAHIKIWINSWEFPFFAFLLFSTLFIKIKFKVH